MIATEWIAAAADFDENGTVNGADLSVWENGFGVANAHHADGDEDVDGNDFLIWQRATQPAAAENVLVHIPEPTAFLLAITALIITAAIFVPH